MPCMRVLCAWPVVCPTELVAFSDRAAEFEDINTNVIAISTDSHHTHLAWIRTQRSEGGLGGMNIPVVGDISKEISRAYGVLVEDPNDDMYGAALRYVPMYSIGRIAETTLFDWTAAMSSLAMILTVARCAAVCS